MRGSSLADPDLDSESSCCQDISYNLGLRTSLVVKLIGLLLVFASQT